MRGWLAAEFVLLFVAIPAAFALMLYSGVRPYMIPTLLVAFGACLLLLLRDPRFVRRNLWRARRVPRESSRIALIFLAAAVGLTGLVVAFLPERFLSLPRGNFGLWATIMVAYPIFSVYPQELIYRAFLFHRYRPLFRTQGALIGASAVAFGLMHIVFLHPVSVLMTLAGGALFAWTYARTRSTLAAAVEHALYGCFIFTVGLGSFFYGGAAFQRASHQRERPAMEAPASPAEDAPLDAVVLLERNDPARGGAIAAPGA